MPARPRLSIAPPEPTGVAAAVRALVLPVAIALLALPPAAGTLAPTSVYTPPGEPGSEWGVYSQRSLRVVLQVDRDDARILAFTVKDTPLVEALKSRSATPAQALEVALVGPGERRHVAGVDGSRLCLDHGPDAPPHIEGDTIRLHRDWFVVELPEREGFDRVVTAWHPEGRGARGSIVLGSDWLDPSRFVQAGSKATWASLAFADVTPVAAKAARTGMPGGVRWPEDFGDGDPVRIYGDPADGARRLNITLVPDGYTHAEKALMEEHADRLVAAFRARTPFREHDPFINYTLVYAYSDDSGTDQCDCGTTASTAMGTGFPTGTGGCGSAANRCLYYGGYCDAASSGNIALAELRAPFHDTTLVMVNTDRYGGCAGARAVFAAGNPAGNEVAIHEIGHSLAGLADEYGGSTACATSAGEINTSVDGAHGAWPEWIDELGAPVEGGQYYENCLYRPAETCQMRSLAREFCPVCRQHWAGLLWSHPRVRPTAPIAGIWPAPLVDAEVGQPVQLVVETRLPGAGTVNEIDWFVAGPGDPTPHWLASGTPSLIHTFDTPGTHRVTVQVVGDAEVIKPVRYGDNVGSAVFDVAVIAPEPPAEVAGGGSPTLLVFADGQRLLFGEGDGEPGIAYNVYRGDRTWLVKEAYGACLAGGLGDPEFVTVEGPPPGRMWFYLVSGSNAAGEGPLGVSSGGEERTPLTSCD